MTEANIPHSGGNLQLHGKNFDRISGQMSQREFLAWETASLDTIDVKRCYVDLAGGDLVAGVLLSQIIYWHLPAKNGRETKLMVEQHGHKWLAKTRGDWWEECRISVKQYDRAARILKSLGLIETRTMRFAGNPTQHTRVCWDVFLRELALITMPVKGGNNDIPQTAITKSPDGEERDAQRETTKSTKREKRIVPKVNVDVDVSAKSLTESTAENTSETPAENTSKKTTNLSSAGLASVEESMCEEVVVVLNSELHENNSEETYDDLDSNIFDDNNDNINNDEEQNYDLE